MAKKATKKSGSVRKALTRATKGRARTVKPAAAKAGKHVYLFGRKTDGNGTMKPLLGGKGANLAEM